MKKYFLLSAVFALVLIGAGCSRVDESSMNNTNNNSRMQDTTGPIKLGWLGPLTGDISAIGQGQRKATELAISEVNAAGGIDGRMIEVVYEDGGCEAKKASNAGNKLINVDKVVAIMGPSCSPELFANAKAANDNKVVMLSPSATAPDITDAGDFIFRIAPSDSFQGEYAANYVYNELGKRKVAVLYVLNDYGTGMHKSFIESFKKLGGEIVYDEGFNPENSDLRGELTKIKNTDAELFYFIAFTQGAITGTKQAKELGLEIPIMGTEVFDDPTVLQSEGAAGVIYTVPVSNESESFKERFLEETESEEMPVFTHQSYDVAKLLLWAIDTADSTSGDAIRDALYSVENYEGVSGMITLDENGDLTSAQYMVREIRDGQGLPYVTQ